MRIGVPSEVKAQEYRVGLTPACVAAYVAHGHQVVVQRGAGEGAGYADGAYAQAGAALADGAEEPWAQDLVVKVKEPLASEFGYFRPGQVVFTYLHLAAAPELATALVDTGVTAVAYETIELEDRSLPCLAPMSAIAGRLSIQEGAKYLERPFGGRGVLLGGVPGVPRGRVVIVGGGVVGTEAARMAVGLGAEVSMLDVSQRRLHELDAYFGGRVQTLYSDPDHLAGELQRADLVVGAVLVPGASAPKLIRREHLSQMQDAAVIVDVAVDQGGCVETTRATTHHDPVFQVDGVQHYCVANMPSAVARTATQALTSVTRPYGLALAEGVDAGGPGALLQAAPALRGGVNVHGGQLVHPAVAAAMGAPQAA